MEIIEYKYLLNSRIEAFRQQGKTIGFVPTMGALHKGHLSLVERAGVKSDIVVVSIFVNPSQFNNTDDLKKYPRNLQQDIEMLEKSPCNVVFAPSVEEIYPEQDTRIFDFGYLDKVMEGLFRPGHFNGVAQVVTKLFDIVKPNKVFFGEKDFQQLAIIRDLSKRYYPEIEIIACPIVREENGLAMSSRNKLLSEEMRQKAAIISQTLFESCIFAKSNEIELTKKFVIEKINTVKELKMEYFEIIDGNRLQAVNAWNKCNYIVGCIAVYAENIRLIDNVIYKNIL